MIKNKRMKYLIAVLMLGIFFVAGCASTPQTNTVNAATGAKTWQTDTEGVHFSLTQIMSEQSQAFYLNRGFSLAQIKPYTSSCIFMVVLRNDDAPGDIHFVSHNWSILVNNKPHKLLPVSHWLERLTTIGAKKSALIAFRWAQFPPEQTYKPGGDWNQGMFSVGLASQSVFDAMATWDIAGKEYAATLTGVQCAK
jgi:hypothetical protein